MPERNTNVLCLFDVDGTLAKSMNKATPEMMTMLSQLRAKVLTGVVGGSNLGKQQSQLGPSCQKDFDFFFAENGLCAFKDGEMLASTSIKDYLGEQNIKELVNHCLKYIAALNIPVKRGTFVEFRNGMINVSPIGRNCAQEERDAFEEYDKKHGVRDKFVKELREKFGTKMGLQFSIGGQISFDVFPKGWDKTFCLRYLEGIPEIHFFGDKTSPGGNDYEIYSHPRTIGHAVTSPEHTMRLLRELFFKDEGAARPVVALPPPLPPAEARGGGGTPWPVIVLLLAGCAVLMQQPGF